MNYTPCTWRIYELLCKIFIDIVHGDVSPLDLLKGFDHVIRKLFDPPRRRKKQTQTIQKCLSWRIWGFAP